MKKKKKMRYNVSLFSYDGCWFGVVVDAKNNKDAIKIAYDKAKEINIKRWLIHQTERICRKKTKINL